MVRPQIKRRKRRHAKRCRILEQPISPRLSTLIGDSKACEDGDSDSEYSFKFVVDFCRKNWLQWVQDSYSEMVQMKLEILERPSYRVANKTANTLVNVECLYWRLVKVRTL